MSDPVTGSFIIFWGINMKISYSYSKWEKEKKNYSKIKSIELTNKNISAHLFSYTHPDEFALNSKFARPIRDKMTLYSCLGDDHYSLAESYYFLDNNKMYTESLYKYLVYKSEAYNNFNNKAENVMVCYELQTGKGFNRLMCTAIVLNEYERIEKHEHFSPIISALYRQDYENADLLISKLPDNIDDSKEIYYLNNCYLKKIFLSILKADEKAFDQAINERIKKLRKSPAGYLTIFDMITAAMIKLANMQGIKYNMNLIEIPFFLLEDRSVLDKENVEFDLY